MNTKSTQASKRGPGWSKAHIKWGTKSGESTVKLTSDKQWRSAAMKKGWRKRRARLAREASSSSAQVAPVASTGAYLDRPAKELRQIGLIYTKAAKLRRKLEQTLASYA